MYFRNLPSAIASYINFGLTINHSLDPTPQRHRTKIKLRSQLFFNHFPPITHTHTSLPSTPKTRKKNLYLSLFIPGAEGSKKASGIHNHAYKWCFARARPRSIVMRYIHACRLLALSRARPCLAPRFTTIILGLFSSRARAPYYTCIYNA